jgi:hypothetical protein
MKMVKDVEKIGFVLGKKDLNKVSNVEKWPII